MQLSFTGIANQMTLLATTKCVFGFTGSEVQGGIGTLELISSLLIA